MRLASALVARLADRGGSVELDELLRDCEAEDRLEDRHRLADRRRTDSRLLELLAEPGQPLRCELPDPVVAEARQDVVDQGQLVELAPGLGQVRHRVQAPIRLDELGQRLVVRDSGPPKLLAAHTVRFERDGVALAVEHPCSLAPALAPAKLPFAVRLSPQIHSGAAFDRRQASKASMI